MRTTLLPALVASTFVLPYLLCGAILFKGVEQWRETRVWLAQPHPWWLMLLFFLLALWAIRWSAHLTVALHKRRQFSRSWPEATAVAGWRTLMVKVGVPLLSLFSALGLQQLAWYHHLIDRQAATVRRVLETHLPGMDSMVQSVAGRSAAALLAGSAAILLLWLAMIVYAALRSSKHPPIQRSVHIHGKLNSLIGLLWTSAKVKGFGLGLKGESVVGVPEDTVFTEKVTSKDWRNGEKAEYTLAFRERFMPHPIEAVFRPEQVKAMLDHLRERRPEGNPLLKKDLLPLARETHLFEALEKGHLAEIGLGRLEASGILRQLLKAKKEPDELDLESWTTELNRSSGLYDFGGFFLAQLYENREGQFTPRFKLRENLQKTLDITTTRDGIGPNFLEKGEVLMALTFTAFGSSDDIPDEDAEEGASHGNERNTLLEYRKTWFHRIIDGFGRAYLFYHEGDKYIYDEWWTGSFKWFNLPFARGPKERAFRRVGYIRRAGGRTVAKIEDTQVPLKLFGSYNRDIAIYDASLADDESFMAQLCCFSQFLTHQQSYRELRLQNSLPATAGYSGGDMDASEQ